MIKEMARKGSRVVITSDQNSSGLFESRLYVSGGETATSISAKHKKINSAKKWAEKQVSI